MHIIKKKSSWLNKGLLARSIIATMQTYAFNDFSFDLYTYHDDLVYFNETPFKLLKQPTLVNHLKIGFDNKHYKDFETKNRNTALCP